MRPLLLLVVLPALGRAGPPTPLPAPDAEAVREASEAAAQDVGLASSASYAHFLEARLAQARGDHRRAVDALRLALVTDEDNPYLLTRLGEAYARLGDPVRAERELRRALERAPRSSEAHLLMGRVLQERRRFSRARVHLQRAVALAPRQPEPALALLQLHLDLGALDEAERVAEALGTALPGEPAAYRRLGLALVERGEMVRAERMLRKAVERDRGDVESLSALARLHERAGRLGDAEAALALALERDPDNREVLLEAGRLALRQGGAARTRAYFDRLLALSSAADAAVQVAAVYMAGGEPATAAEVLDGARQAGTVDPRLSFYAGLVHERLRQFDAAAVAFGEVPRDSGLFGEALARRALSLSRTGAHGSALELLRQGEVEQPGAPEVVAALARVLERTGDVAQAETVLRRALGRRPSPRLVEALAALQQRRGRHREAVALLERWVRRLPHDERLRHALGSAHAEAGSLERALRTMRELVRRAPESAPALNLLGYTLADSGRRLDEAERLVRRALALSPDTGSYLDSLGWVLYRRGDLDGALVPLQRAAALEPGEPLILEHLGDVLRDLGRAVDALGAYRRALEALRADPDAGGVTARRPVLERKLRALSARAAGH